MAELFADAADRFESTKAATAHEKQVRPLGGISQRFDALATVPVDHQAIELLSLDRCGIASENDAERRLKSGGELASSGQGFTRPGDPS